MLRVTKSVIATAIRGILRRSPLILVKLLTRKRPVAFLFHSVTDDASPHLRHVTNPSSPEQFEVNLVFFRHYFSIITHEELLEHYRDGAKLPSNSIVLTFDDGLRDSFEVIRPLLLKHLIPATFFVPTRMIDNKELMFRHKVSLCIESIIQPTFAEAQFPLLKPRIDVIAGESIASATALTAWIRNASYEDLTSIDALCDLLGVDVEGYLAEVSPYVTSEQVKTMVSEGFTIGAHGVHHRKLNRDSPATIREEVETSCREIGELVGQAAVSFAFPFSGREVDGRDVDVFEPGPTTPLLWFDTQGIRDDKRTGVINRIGSDAQNAEIAFRNAVCEEVLDRLFLS